MPEEASCRWKHCCKQAEASQTGSVPAPPDKLCRG
jgi:hypothetical protein